ncbi:MAG: ABC transporter ATP-binding protein [Lachnospiraceae bacterium]|nr:ABC transporter ATP-binding protein [Lachnospiraceae bacterium]
MKQEWKTVVATQNLSKKYGNQYSVKQINLEVPEHAIYGFLGPNGAGKSTTLKMLLGLTEPTEGSIRIFGKPVEAKNRIELLRQTGSLIESPSYYGHLTGEDNLKLVAALKNVNENQIPEILSIVNLEEQKTKKAVHYSLGMKQRLGLAMALLGFPRLLILDEPTNGLDPAGIQEMRELIASLPGIYEMSVIVSSHMLSEIDLLANYVGIIDRGNLIFQNSLEQLHLQSRGNLLLRVDQPERAKIVLQQRKISAVISEGKLLLSPMRDVDAGRIARLLMEEGMEIYRMESHEKTLEEIFLSLTHGSAEGSGHLE